LQSLAPGDEKGQIPCRMDIVERSKILMLGMGARPILWLLLGLSVISLAVMIERGWLLYRLRDDLARLLTGLRGKLRDDDRAAARELLGASQAPAAVVALAGLAEAEQGVEATAQAMDGAKALERRRLERRLAFLGTLGNNAPFVGLFGTVIGIMEAFQKLGEAGREGAAAAGSAPDVMGGIAEALVATAVGLAVAIPAVAAYNYLQRRIKGLLADADVLGAIVLGHVQRRTNAVTRPEREV
jgi:biopolymer transport protein ExbB